MIRLTDAQRTTLRSINPGYVTLWMKGSDRQLKALSQKGLLARTHDGYVLTAAGETLRGEL